LASSVLDREGGHDKLRVSMRDLLNYIGVVSCAKSMTAIQHGQIARRALVVS
jgi:hypothetical protein